MLASISAQEQAHDRTAHGIKRLEIDNCCLGLAMSGNHNAPLAYYFQSLAHLRTNIPYRDKPLGFTKILGHAQQLVGLCAAHTR